MLLFYKAIIEHDLEVEDQISFSNSIIALLKHERFQKLAIAQDDITLIICLMIFSYTQDPTTISDLTLSLGPISHKVQSTEDEGRLSAMRQSLLGAIWDLSALPEFTAQYPPTSDRVHMFVSWLQVSEPQRQLCACYVLRNMAISDEASSCLVQQLHVHKPLIHILKSTTDVPVLGEVLRLLRNLALPTDNKQLICASGQDTMESIITFWSQSFLPTLQHAAASLVRVLLKGCIPNIHLFLTGHHPSQAPPDASSGHISRLISLFQASEDSSTRVEAARILVELWRTAHLQAPWSEAYTMIPSLLTQEAQNVYYNLAEPVIWMIMKSRNPSLVTEGWFGLTLMARSKEAGEAVFEAISKGEALDMLKSTVDDQDSGSRDRDNALILVQKLLGNNVSFGNLLWESDAFTNQFKG